MWIANNYTRGEMGILRAFSLSKCQRVQNDLRQQYGQSKHTLRAYALSLYRAHPDSGIAIVSSIRKGLR